MYTHTLNDSIVQANLKTGKIELLVTGGYNTYSWSQAISLATTQNVLVIQTAP